MEEYSTDMVKVNGYTFRGSNCVISVFSLLNGITTENERISCHKSKFFPLKVEPISGELYCIGKLTVSYKSCFPW